MRSCYVVALAILIGLSTVDISFAQDRSPNEVRHEVEQLCQNREVVSAFHMAMKSLLQARRKFGSDDSRTAECMTVVAGVAKHRKKYYLAESLYKRALSIQEKALGSTDPGVARCRAALDDLRENHGL